MDRIDYEQLFIGGKPEVSLPTKKMAHDNMPCFPTGFVKKFGATSDFFLNKKSSVFKYRGFATYSSGKVNYEECGYPSGIRPVILNPNMDYIKRICKETHGIKTIQYGEIPQTEISGFGSGSAKLIHLRNKNELETTDKDYYFSFAGSTNHFDEFEYRGDKYVIAFCEPFYSCFKVEPIIWIVDEDNGILISKDIIDFGPMKTVYTVALDRKLYLNIVFLDNIKPSMLSGQREDNKSNSLGGSQEYDKEIQELVNEINNICGNFPEEIKNRIYEELKQYNDEYKNSIKNKELPLTLSRSSNIFLNNDGDPRITYILRLNSLKNSLIQDQNLIKQINILVDYKKMLNNEVIKKPENDGSIEYAISYILYVAYLSENNIKERIIKILDTEINTAIDKASKIINELNTLDVKKMLTLDPEQDILKDFNKAVLELKDNIDNHQEIYKLFDKLNEALNAEKVLKPREIISIVDMIYQVKYIISLVGVFSVKEKLIVEMNMFQYHFLEKSYARMKKYPLTIEDYENLCVELQKRIQKILEELRDYSNIDVNEIIDINSKDLLENLLRRIYKHGKKYLRDTELPLGYAQLKVIQDYFEELFNRIDECELEEYEKQTLIEEIKKDLENWIKRIDDEDITPLIYEIIKELYSKKRVLEDLLTSRNNVQK